MRQKIIISKPYIKEEKSEIFGESVKLCAMVKMLNPNNQKLEEKECYFEFEKKYKKYICFERSDAFVMGLISSAMELGMDIEFEMPISERLYYQLTNYYIPMISENNAKYPMYNIKLIGPTDNTVIKNEGAVATGCSGGVDSFYTILKYSKNNCDLKNYQLTHLVYSSSGTLDKNSERMKNNFKNVLSEITKITEECNLETIACFNNLNEFYKFPYKAFNMFYTTVFSATSFALEKLIKIYYVSSGNPIHLFNLNLTKVPSGHDSSVFDLFTLDNMNTENLTFYSVGMDCERMDKEKYIVDFKPTQKHLMVCAVESFFTNKTHNYRNCGICEKCLRTMAHIYALGEDKLKKYSYTFDVDNFLKHKAKYIGKMMGSSLSVYVKEMKKTAKENNVRIPFCSYIYAYLWYKPIKYLRKIFGESLLARKIYYKLNLDYKLDGHRGPTYEAYKDKIK